MSGTLERTRCRLKAHPLALDATLAAGVLVCMVAGSFVDPHGDDGVTWGIRTPDALALVLMTLGALALVFRRRAPRTVLALTGTVALVECVVGDPRAPVAMAAVIALFTVAATTDRPTTWRLGLLTMTVLTGASMLAGPLPWYAQENLAIFAWTGIGATAGDAVRSRRAVVQAIRERAERAERTREEEARRRVAEERLRIARDLHDVVAHHIALVNVQAGVAAHVMDKRPDQAKEALAHVREASRSALNELRATVGLLRQSGDPEAPTEPAPGLERLDELVGTFRSAGLHVEVARADHGTTLPAAVGLAAYRVIQEALTNVQKHAGTEAKAEVSVVRVGPNIEITVLDNGSGEDDDPTSGGGHGLLGMRERVTALRGTLTTGPRYGGGFRVHAILPVRTRSRAAEDAV
ncbi:MULTISPECIES: sensor histidine kinase [unclassified Streptomyces]|uniref:sensor histidine kinase n=1 Tax=unclassified Streptomyces TaxID=2593676 RepID=UPI00224EE473|nr:MULTISPECIES: sensor histidine kinase [unclassified Streptomyces]MCX5047621.1 sensor histidine kinase [Streptomyces sp. NBC_00474]MCX5057690.1 sensor histidine kinase [Streptomyces sp. NBC_00452]MCX5245432.1 sensor histidine kinase [Streptomyces sp. NBC_00201]MCX5288790.1 sensor histidine kinase [Streptomyces sp. NBC_00183]